MMAWVPLDIKWSKCSKHSRSLCKKRSGKQVRLKTSHHMGPGIIASTKILLILPPYSDRIEWPIKRRKIVSIDEVPLLLKAVSLKAYPQH